VFINSFNVYFQVFGSARASTAGGEMLGTMKGRTNVAMGVGIENVDSKDFQQITNEVYRHFVQHLQSHGYELVSPDEAAKTEVFSDWVRKQGGQHNSAQSLGYLKATPEGYEYFIRKETKKGKEKTVLLANQHIISSQLGNAIIAGVNFVFDFVSMKTFSNEFIGMSQVTGVPNYRFSRMVGDANNHTLSSITFQFGKNLTAAEAALFNNLKSDTYSDKPVVNKKDKVRERAVAASTTIPDYASIIFVNDNNMNISHSLPVDHDLYVSECTRFMTQFIDVSMSRLKEVH
jgi:hypothetical protein